MLMLQTHYRSPLDFSTERLNEADAALTRIENALKNFDWLISNADDNAQDAFDENTLRAQVEATKEAFAEAMDDDFNAPGALGAIFTLVNELNSLVADKTLNTSNADVLTQARQTIVELLGVLGINAEGDTSSSEDDSYPAAVIDLAAEVAAYVGSSTTEAVEALLAARAEARANKDWGKADAVRDGLIGLGFVIEDTPQGARVTYQG
jgi:cysteinyl-tRNA synthetase